MKNIFYVICLALSLNTQVGFADANDNRDNDGCHSNYRSHVCHNVYRDALKSCDQDLKGLPKSARNGAQRGCTEKAREAKEACLASSGSGSAQCVSACEATNAAAVATCDANYNPLGCDPADVVCIATVTQQQSDCISAATAALNTCSAACTPVVAGN